ncbi:DUF2207 domain-containing protein [Nocardiopsis nanhaiensis]
MRQRNLGGRFTGVVVSTFALVTVLAPPSLAGESGVQAASDTESPSPHHNEKITEYHTSAEVHPDGTVDVVEEITYDFDTNTSPGIYRDIPVVLERSLLTERVVEIHDLDVTSPTGAETRLDSAGVEGRDYVIQVGLEDEPGTHVTGEQTYELSYTLEGALLALDDHDEFYWDFVGPGWDVPKEDVSVSVTAPEVIDISCYRGQEGSTTACDSTGSEGSAVEASEPHLGSSEILTVAVSMPKGEVDTSASLHETRSSWIPGPHIFVLALVLVVAVIAMAAFRVRSGAAARNRFDRIPPGLSPAAAHTMHRSTGMLTPKDLMIMLVQLEERGLVTSQPHPGTPGDWIFHLRVNPRDPALSPAEHVLLRDLFAGAPSTDLQNMAMFLRPSLTQSLNRCLYEEKRALGLCPKPATYLLGRVLPPLVCLGAGLALLFTGDAMPVPGAGYIALLLFGYALASITLLGFGPYNADGRRVRGLLKRARADSSTGGPASVIGSPSWELAVGMPSEELDRLAHAHQQHTYGPRPYYYDRMYMDRWHRVAGRGMYPQSSGGGGAGGFSSGGGFGGGSAGGGGGGGSR